MTEKTERPALELVTSEPSVGEFPRTFGDYLLLSPLGQGGMGDVYLAKHGSIAGIEKTCVLKTLRPQFTDDREYVSRFIDEARVVVQLSHKNICHVFDVNTVDGRYYLAMEYIAGRDLKTLLSSAQSASAKIDLGLVVHIISEVLEALDYAHRHLDPSTGEPLRLVHRDVSPQNVMVSFEGEVKLIDFGLAASTLKLERTEPNVVMGKVAYMSPEQLRGDVVDGRTDLFATAVMLYELLANERYYEGKSPYEIWALASTSNYQPAKWHELDADLRAVLSKGLAPIETRFKTCAEMRQELEEIRVKRGLRGSTLMLRDVVERTMPAEISDSRLRLAKFKNVKLLRTEKQPSAPTATVRQPPESTEAVRRELMPAVNASSKKTLLAAAGIITAGLFAVALVLALRPNGAQDVVAGAPAAHELASAVHDVVPAVPAVPAVVPAVPAVPAVPDAPAAHDTAPSATHDVAPAEAKHTHTSTGASKHVSSAASSSAASATTTTPAAAQTAPAAKGFLDDAKAFVKRCPTLPCARDLSTMADVFKDRSKDMDWMRKWAAEVRECRATCK